MSVLVTYATKHGATQGIAEHIGKTLQAEGQPAEVCAVTDVATLDGYEAFVIGSASYMGHWRKEAVEFLRQNLDFLADRPVWLFSSGTLGTKATDDKGRDLREAAKPKEVADLAAAVATRDHRAFFGALDPGRLTLAERSLRTLPAGRAMLPDGDFRDWEEIASWATGIAHALAGTGR